MSFFLVFLALGIGPARSQDRPDGDLAELRSQIANLNRLVASLSNRVEELETARSLQQEISSAVSQSVVRPVPRREGPPAAGSGSTYQNLNPDISVIGVATAKATGDRLDPGRNALTMDESELVFSKSVSPYTRATLILGYQGEEGEVEEAFADLSHLLPGGWEARVGKFLVPTGILNPIHSHDWPMTVAPLPIEFFYGEESLSQEGVSFSNLIDTRSKTYMRLTLDGLRGDDSILFNSGKTRVFGGRLTGNTPLNVRDDLNFGLNFHRGAWNPARDLDSDLAGIDLMWRRRFNQFDRLTFWGEYLWNRREQVQRSSLTAAGYYMAAMYRFRKDRTWHVGLEYDCSERPGDGRFNSIAAGVFAGYWFTENDRLQLQFRRVRDPSAGRDNNEIMLQFIWGMGPHKPHLANF